IILLFGLLAGVKYVVDLGDKIEHSGYTFNNEFGSDSQDSQAMTPGTNARMTTQKLSSSAISYAIELPYGNISIMPTGQDDAYVEYSSDCDIEVQTREDAGYLRLNVKMPKNISKLFHIDENDVKINFYLPKDELEKLSIDMKAGYLKVYDMKAYKFSLEMAAGNAVVKGCVFEEITTDLNAGNLDLYTDVITKHIDSEVAAGNMRLMLPEDITGFLIKYKVDLGNLSNKLSFNIYDSSKGYAISKSGELSYGDKSCKIDLDVAIGNISLNEYK
ncbi:MAG: DUF4097 family beta strand repeat-containing protein, partial [Oscillospiraceae bacterium]